MSNTTYKCAYKHCQHESCDIPQDDAVKVGNRYMHSDCAEKSKYIIRIRDLYYEKVSNTVVVKQLVSVINNIITKKNIDPAYLYFALDYAITNKIPLRSPYGLHYLVDNNRIKDAWNKKKADEIAKQIREEARETDANPVTKNSFNYSAQKSNGFSEIFKGGI